MNIFLLIFIVIFSLSPIVSFVKYILVYPLQYQQLIIKYISLFKGPLLLCILLDDKLLLVLIFSQSPSLNG